LAKVLAKAGDSLADVYDVEGSIAGVEDLMSENVNLVHEMGSTIFSERFGTTIRRMATGAVAQNTVFDTVLVDLPAGAFRILGVAVLADVAARLSRVMVALQDPVAGRELPMFVWDSVQNVDLLIRIQDNNNAINVNMVYLLPSFIMTPNMGSGVGQPQRVERIQMRGVTSGFGAGTVDTIAIIHIGLSEVGGVSSRGLPLPSW